MKPKRGRSCARKQQIPSESAAKATRARLIAQGAFAGSVHVYRCRFAPLVRDGGTWGTVESCRRYLADLADDCRSHPLATVRVSH